MTMGKSFKSQLRTIQLSKPDQKSRKRRTLAKINPFAVIVKTNQNVGGKDKRSKVYGWGNC